ncbi:response regulator [Lysinibacillus fusiformis]|nr:response regulator [Lysinibacillus fusiformis]
MTMRILVADDSRFMRSYIMKMLHEAGYTDLLEAENGLKAVEIYKLYRPSIVIMDFNMPVLDGLGALKKIKNMNMSAKVMMCTSMGGQKWIAEELIGHGAAQVIEKPYFQNLIPGVNKIAEELFMYQLLKPIEGVPGKQVLF